MDKKKVGLRIREYRRKAHITQEVMAEAMGISVTAVSNIERGLNFPTFENFIKIVNILGVSADLLLLDVIDSAYVSKASELSEVLKAVPAYKRKQIFDVIETMVGF